MDAVGLDTSASPDLGAGADQTIVSGAAVSLTP